MLGVAVWFRLRYAAHSCVISTPLCCAQSPNDITPNRWLSATKWSRSPVSSVISTPFYCAQPPNNITPNRWLSATKWSRSPVMSRSPVRAQRSEVEAP